MDRNTWNNLTIQSRILWLAQYQVVSSFPKNRPAVVAINIPVTAGATDKVFITDLLKNYQLLSIVGFTSTGVTSRTTGLAAKIASIAGGTFDEHNYIDSSVLQSPGYSIAGLNCNIIESEDLVISMAGGHGLQELHFYCLPATWEVNTDTNQLFD